MFKFVECRHILPTGRKCHSPALRVKSYCYHHMKLQFRRWGSRDPKTLKTIAHESLSSLQTAVAEALTSLRSPLTDPKRAAVILYGLNLANNLFKQTQKLSRVAPNRPKPTASKDFTSGPAVQNGIASPGPQTRQSKPGLQSLPAPSQK